MECDLESYRRHQRYLAFVANGFLVSQILRTLHAFDGDLLAAVVLGEIAQHNVQGLFRDRRTVSGEEIEGALADPKRREALLRPCNALSISESTGIPRETVRRRIERLVTGGWVVRNHHGHLFVTDALIDRLAHFHLETAKSVMETAETVRRVLAAPGTEARPPVRIRVDAS